MKIPESPPLLSEFIQNIPQDKLIKLITLNIGMTDTKGRYVHWEKLKYHIPPKNFSSEEYWVAIKLARQNVRKEIPLQDTKGMPFGFCVPDSLQKQLHWLDQNAAGHITMDQAVTNPHTRNTYLINSLIEEAISSSQLEGASTTRNVAKEMLRQNRPPQDHSEHMIVNNYKAMQMIQDFKEDDLTPALILRLHEILTQNTLDDATRAGQYRTNDDDIRVIDGTGTEVLHIPPKAESLPQYMEQLCHFANHTTDENGFIHPVIKAVILHFMLGYIHPFIDGNGGTARALFYWAMAKQDYWLIEFISISRIIKQAPIQYGTAYLHTETDDNDLTYFLIHQMDVIKQGITALHQYLHKKADDIEEVEKLLEHSQAKGELNYRQLSLLKHAIKHPNAIYRIKQHQAEHKITYQTARTDLLKMSDELNLLRRRKYGKEFVFISPPDLKVKLQAQ
ncbi:Fic family protein [Candidatus Albibeggiatoa sp. nov. BB20]|uniref:Fic family protein n=1 Tax=Candidatus Albibeggiatoa sp. nov. BB20 TaxID=3162723 RepID=UPI0033654E48